MIILTMPSKKSILKKDIEKKAGNSTNKMFIANTLE